MAVGKATLNLRKAELQASVAEALHHLGDVIALENSILIELPEVRRRSVDRRSVFADGEALNEVLSEIVEGLILRLTGLGRIALIRATLEGVARGESIARIARDQGKTREWWSRHYWKLAVGLVAEEILALNGQSRSGTLSPGHGHRNRVPAFQNCGSKDDKQ